VKNEEEIFARLKFFGADSQGISQASEKCESNWILDQAEINKVMDYCEETR